VECVAPVGSFADDLDTADRLQLFPKQLASDGLVVHDEGADAAEVHLGYI